MRIRRLHNLSMLRRGRSGGWGVCDVGLSFIKRNDTTLGGGGGGGGPLPKLADPGAPLFGLRTVAGTFPVADDRVGDKSFLNDTRFPLRRLSFVRQQSSFSLDPDAAPNRDVTTKRRGQYSSPCRRRRRRIFKFAFVNSLTHTAVSPFLPDRILIEFRDPAGRFLARIFVYLYTCYVHAWNVPGNAM